MAEWHCFKCKEKAVAGKVKLGFMDYEVDEEALICPKCRAAYLTEETTIERVLPSEDLLEEK